MASRYNSVYLFQHSLMNLPFVNINNIIHPNAENTPHPLLHFASAMYYNSQYWEDTDRVRADLEHESHYNDYKDKLHKLSFNDANNIFTVHRRYHLSFLYSYCSCSNRYMLYFIVAMFLFHGLHYICTLMVIFFIIDF